MRAARSRSRPVLGGRSLPGSQLAIELALLSRIPFPHDPAHSSPAQEDSDVARHAAGEIHDLRAQLVSLRLELLLPELVGTLGKAGQRLRPVGLEVVDRPAAIGAVLARNLNASTSRSPRSAAPRTSAANRSRARGSSRGRSWCMNVSRK